MFYVLLMFLTCLAYTEEVGSEHEHLWTKNLQKCNFINRKSTHAVCLTDDLWQVQRRNTTALSSEYGEKTDLTD